MFLLAFFIIKFYLPGKIFLPFILCIKCSGIPNSTLQNLSIRLYNTVVTSTFVKLLTRFCTIKDATNLSAFFACDVLSSADPLDFHSFNFNFRSYKNRSKANFFIQRLIFHAKAPDIHLQAVHILG